MRRFAIGALLTVMPFGGVRVICVDAPVPSSDREARVEAVSDCERLCPLHRPPDTASDSEVGSDSRSASDCALSVDGASLSVVVSVAPPRPQVAFPVSLVAAELLTDTPHLYVEPAPAHLAPPPKSPAL